MPRSTFLFLFLFLLLASDSVVLGQIPVPLRHIVRKSSVTNNQSNVLSLTNVNDYFFVGDIMIGTPPQTLSVQYDTGSAILWVASTLCTSKTCADHNRFESTQSSTFKPSAMTFNETYGDGSNSNGVLGADTISLGGITIQNQQFGLASLMDGFKEPQIDGLIGLGLFSMNGSALENGRYVEPLENMFDQKLISKRLFSVAFHLYSTAASDGANGGELLFGAINTDKFIGNLTYVNVARIDGNQPFFWAIQLDGVAIGSKNIFQPNVINAIVDTGSSFLYVPQAAWESFSKELGAFVDSVLKLPWLDCDSSAGLNITYIINGQPFPVPSAYWMAQTDGSDTIVRSVQFGSSSRPSFLNPGRSKYCYAKIDGVPGDMWFLSIPFLQYYYSVFDADNMRIGFAPQVGTGASPMNAASLRRPSGLLCLVATAAALGFITRLV